MFWSDRITVLRAMDSGLHISGQNRLALVKKVGPWDEDSPDKEVALLKMWLAAERGVGKERLKMIFERLFCCACNADKQPIQANLIGKPCSIIRRFDLQLVQQYFQVFLAVMRREWSGIDHFGDVQFNLLFRQILHYMFLALDSNGWDSKLVEMGDMMNRAFIAVNKQLVQGNNLLFADVHLNRLHGVFPTLSASDRCLPDIVKDSVIDCLFQNGRNLLKSKQEGQAVNEKVKNPGSVALIMGMAKRLFQSAALSSTLHANMRVQYNLQEEFSKYNKHLSESGALIPPCWAQKPKIYDSQTVDQSLEMETVAIQELPLDSSEVQSQLANKIESMEQGREPMANKSGKRTRSGKRKRSVNDIHGSFTRKSKAKGPNNPVGSSTKKSKVKEGSYICESLSHCEELQDATTEISCNRLCSYHDSLNLVKEAKSMDLVAAHFGDSVKLDVSVITNIQQQQFVKAAVELDGCASPISSLMVAASPLNTVSKKRKRLESKEDVLTRSSTPSNSQEKGESVSGSDLFNGVESAGKSVERKVKKVRFSLKNNLVWKPHNPLPPESLRVPPSATPRGSALKKGVPPGPIYIIQKPPTKKLGSRQRSTSTRKSSKNSKSTSTPKVLRKQRSIAR